MYEKILVGVDGSDGAAKALSAAIMLAKRLKAQLHMIGVEELPRFPASIEEVVEEQRAAKHELARAGQQARAKAKVQQVDIQVHLVAGHPVPTIVDFIGRESFRSPYRGLYGPFGVVQPAHRQHD